MEQVAKIRIPIPEGIKEQFDKYQQLLQIEGYDLSQFFVAPSLSTDPAIRTVQEQYNIDYMMREHKVPRTLVFAPDSQEQIFVVYWVYPDFDCLHENFYVPDAEYNHKYNKVLFPDLPDTATQPLTDTESVDSPN